MIGVGLLLGSATAIELTGNLLAAAFLVRVVVILLTGDKTRLSPLMGLLLLAAMAPFYALAQRATTQEYASK